MRVSNEVREAIEKAAREGRVTGLDSSDYMTTEEVKLTEKEFQYRVINYAEDRGWKYYHTHLSLMSPEGFPDLVLCRPHEAVIFAELKTERGKQTGAQLLWQQALEAAEGVKYFLWRPGDWPQIQEILK